MRGRVILTGADVVLPDRLLGPVTLVVESGLVVEVRPGTLPPEAGSEHVDLTGHVIVPGFVDTHVHGTGGRDVLDGPDAVRAIAALLPRHGVTAFCPTTAACPPAALRVALDAVREARQSPAPGAARVLRAHLESNFLNADYKGAQPAQYLRRPARLPVDTAPGEAVRHGPPGADAPSEPDDTFTAAGILAEIHRAAAEVGTITMAPELPGAIELIGDLAASGHRVSLGHSGASFDEGRAAIASGATGGTHLFNRMPPLGHREPGLAGAILADDRASAEIICDGHHVHPAMIAMTVAAKRPSRVVAITDGTAGSGLPAGRRARLGSHTIVVRETAAYLEDGTLAGSVLTMDRAFRVLVGLVGLGLVEAAALCATTPARELGLVGQGSIAAGAAADLVVLDRDLRVVQTYVGGVPAFSAC